MLISNDKHQWSPTGEHATWTKPMYSVRRNLGGSADLWANDGRRQLNFWGHQSTTKGGCCSSSYQIVPKSSGGPEVWGLPFTVSYGLFAATITAPATTAIVTTQVPTTKIATPQVPTTKTATPQALTVCNGKQESILCGHLPISGCSTTSEIGTETRGLCPQMCGVCRDTTETIDEVSETTSSQGGVTTESVLGPSSTTRASPTAARASSTTTTTDIMCATSTNSRDGDDNTRCPKPTAVIVLTVLLCLSSSLMVYVAKKWHSTDQEFRFYRANHNLERRLTVEMVNNPMHTNSVVGSVGSTMGQLYDHEQDDTRGNQEATRAQRSIDKAIAEAAATSGYRAENAASPELDEFNYVLDVTGSKA
jgi:hypothetical protein